MPHPRARRLMRRQIGAYVLQPAGLTNVGNGDATNASRVANLQNIALYEKAGITPTFTAGSTTQLSDVLSNADTAWTKAGLTGETTNVGAFVSSSLSGNVGLSATAGHYYFPAMGTMTTMLGNSAPASPFIIYSNEGPQASYVPYYLGGTAQTASFKLGPKITGSGSPTHIAIYVGGELAAGDQIRLLNTASSAVLDAKIATGSDISFSAKISTSATASATELSSALYRKVFLVETGAVSTGMVVEFSSSAKTSTAPVAGVFVVVSSGSYP